MVSTRFFLVIGLLSLALLVGCDGDTRETVTVRLNGAGGAGGMSSGAGGAGGAINNGQGGNGAMGGQVGNGGSPGAGGQPGNGGAPGAGGQPGSGGTPGAGGQPGTGGTPGAGGQPGSGGAGGGAPMNGRGSLGDACANNDDCASGLCIAEFPSGYCSKTCETSDECEGGSCWDLGAAESLCLKNCEASGECREADGYICDGDSTCYPGMGGGNPPAAGDTPIGGPCEDDSECVGPNNRCIPAQSGDGPTGFVDGYCYQLDCSEERPCPAGAECFRISEDGDTACLDSCNNTADCRGGYSCEESGACMPGCSEDSPCPDGLVCNDELQCVEPPCTPDSCPAGTVCGDAGRCVLDIGNVPAGAVPDCAGVGGWQCDGNDCRQVVQFEPVEGTGYVNYPLNGETWNDQYRSYARRDTVALVKYASAMTACLSQNWEFGVQMNGAGAPLGLGDMSEANGDIPGTRENQPGHPEGTHVNGFDMDIAYYQLNSANNYLRSVCNHISGGRDQYHCVDDPNNFDVWRTAIFLAAMHDSPQLRVIGVDGRIGQMVDSAMDQLCAAGYLRGNACNARLRSLAYEVEDTGRGWYRFHHHHFHISLTTRQNAGFNNARIPAEHQCLLSDCGEVPRAEEDPRRHHVHDAPEHRDIRPIHAH